MQRRMIKKHNNDHATRQAPTRYHVIMDVDMGVDDAIAVIAALHNPSIHLVGVTTVAGNTSSQQAALNTLFLLEQFNLRESPPVRVGAGHTLRGVTPHPVPHVHGPDGLGGVSRRYWATRSKPRIRTGASEYLLESTSRYGNTLSIVATGPLTNIAQAIQQAPEIMRELGQLLIMGGALDRPGNITPHAEFNAHTDPEALAVILSSGLPITLFPLNVTEQVQMSASALKEQLVSQPRKMRLIQDLTYHYCQFHRETLGLNGFFLHDVLPVIALDRPDLFNYRSISLDIEVSDRDRRGALRRRYPQNRHTSVAVEIAAQATLETIWTILQRPDPTTHYSRVID